MVSEQTKKNITKFPADNDEFAACFLKQVAARSQAAGKRKTTLFIMVFAPVTPEHDIVLDFDPRPTKKKHFLTVETIRDTIRNAVKHNQLPVVLLTESALTGGWMCNPWLFNTGTPFHPNRTLQVISRSCGGIFADTFMQSFTKRGTPLLTDEQRSMVLYEDMTPIGATDEQTALLHKFQRAIHETLEFRLSPIGRRRLMFCDDCTDAWSIFAPRKGYDLNSFWAAKLISPDRMDIDEIDRFEFLGEAFGGSRESQIFHLKYLVSIEFETCPGDWTRNMTGITASMLSEFFKNPKPDAQDFKRVFDAIEFRGSLINLAHILAKALDLPIPEVKCRYWEDEVRDDALYAKLQAGFADVHSLFSKPAILPGENRHAYKHVRFYRPSRWISAALALKFAEGSDNDIRAFIAREIAPLVKVIRQAQESLLLETPHIVYIGNKWIGSLNLGIEVSGKETATNADMKKAPGQPLAELFQGANGGIDKFHNTPEKSLAEPIQATSEGVDQGNKTPVEKSVLPLATSWDEFEKHLHAKVGKASQPEPYPHHPHWANFEETPNMHEADQIRKEAVENDPKTGFEITSEEYSSQTLDENFGTKLETDMATSPEPDTFSKISELIEATLTSLEEQAPRIGPAETQLPIENPPKVVDQAQLAKVESAIDALIQLRDLIQSRQQAKETAPGTTPETTPETVETPATISDEIPIGNAHEDENIVSLGANAEAGASADMFGLTPPQTPTNMRTSENHRVRDQEDEAVNGTPEFHAEREPGLIAGEDFWSRVKW